MNPSMQIKPIEVYLNLQKLTYYWDNLKYTIDIYDSNSPIEH